MLSSLEHYLEQLEQSLQSLPGQEREAEIREVRQHLELLMADRMEKGESQEEALLAAIQQFGQATSHSKDLRWAWRRGHNRRQRQALRRNLRVVVGTRQGKAVIYWPGVSVLLALMVAINVVIAGTLSFVLTRDFLFLVPQTLMFMLPLELTTIVGSSIKRGLQTPPDHLTRLEE